MFYQKSSTINTKSKMTITIKQGDYHFKQIDDVVVINRTEKVTFDHCEIAEWKMHKAKMEFDKWFDELEKKYDEEQLNKYY